MQQFMPLENVTQAHFSKYDLFFIQQLLKLM